MKKLMFAIIMINSVLLFSWNSGVSVFPASANACDYCLMTRGFSPIESRTGLNLRLDTRYTSLNSIFSGAQKLQNYENEKETHFTTQATFLYTFNRKFSLVGVLPVARRMVSVNLQESFEEVHHERTEENEAHEHEIVHRHDVAGSSFDVGDVSILGRYTIFHIESFKHSTEMKLETGLKIPSGKTNVRGSATEFLDAHIQPGTGSWNYLLGVSANHINNYFSLTGNVLYSFNSTGQAGDDEYRYGNWLNVDLTGKYRVYSTELKTRNVFLTLGLDGEFRGKEKINKNVLENTGGYVLYLTPGIQLKLARMITVEGGFHYPFYHNLNGLAQLFTNTFG